MYNIMIHDTVHVRMYILVQVYVRYLNTSLHMYIYTHYSDISIHVNMYISYVQHNDP